MSGSCEFTAEVAAAEAAPLIAVNGNKFSGTLR